MRVDILTKEYPPTIYGGAGVHVAELTRALRARGDLEVRVEAFGPPRDEAGTTGFADPAELAGANAALVTMGVDLAMAAATEGASLVHSHTWYANFAGHTAALLHGIPHVVSAHSLEPMRPWKAEQLGGGYRLSSWIERTAYEAADAVIAVSDGMRQDVLRSYPQVDPDKVRVIHNGIDAQLWQRHRDEDTVRRHGVNPDQRSVIFVGRITRQKGLPYLLRAVAQLPPDVQVVLLAGAPDTAEIKAEVEGLIADLRLTREGVVWIPDMLPRAEVIALLSAATVFVCPSVYEPLGIVNLEAMACEVRPGSLRRRFGCRAQRGGQRSGPRRPNGPSGPSARHRPLLVAADRRSHESALPGCAASSTPWVHVMSDVLAFAGVGVVRGQTTLLDDVSWEVEEGQRWVILGPNGAGKTTLHAPHHRSGRHPR